MTRPARQIRPARATYSGGATDPARWAAWTPREGDILVCTPPKCGTTWTQTMLMMLVNGGPDLPDTVGALSPWIDANIGLPFEEVSAALDRQPGRRVVKTHTPADGFPLFEGVTVISVFRHPLDLFFSLRKHVANTVSVPEVDLPFLDPVPDNLRFFLTQEADRADWGRETLAKVALHYRMTACEDHGPGLHVAHYADMLRDGRAAVARLAGAIGIDDDALIDTVAKATSFGAMKARAASYAPIAGIGYWRSDAGFFDSASSRKWEGKLTGADLAAYSERLADLLPDAAARSWLENGEGPAQGA